MDTEMDIDDLFGDGAATAAVTHLPPQSKEILQKVDEMRRSSCNQKLVWSKTGLILAVNANGHGIEMRNVRCHPDDGSWDLSEATVIPQFNQNLDGGPLQHVHCSPTGNEIALVDAVGRIAIIGYSNCLNKPSMLRPALRDQVDDLNALAGCHWFNSVMSQIILVHGPAVLDRPQLYKYENIVFNPPSSGPCHPIHSLSSLLCLTVNGVLRLLFPEQKGAWSEARLELESVVSSDDLITHAAFCNEKNRTVLVAYATANRRLCLVRVSVDWGLPAEPRQGPIILNPRLEAEHLTVASWMVSDGQEDISSKFSLGSTPPSHAKSSMLCLSHLDILPAIIDRNGHVSTPPTVITVRSHVPSSPAQFNQEVYSTIDRWTFQESTQTLHPAFEHLSARRNSNAFSPNNIYRQLKSMTCLTVDKIILSIHAFNPAYAKTLCIAYSDGSIEYRDRNSLAEISLNERESLQRFFHLSQVGFAYPSDEACVHVAMSPTFCSAVQMDHRGKIKWKRLEYHPAAMIPDDAQRSAANAAFSLCMANALHQHATIDDLLDIAYRSRSSPSLSFQTELPPELARILNLRVDFSAEAHHENLVRNHFLHATLGLLHALGHSGAGAPRTLAARLAWLALSIRHCVFLTTLAGNQKPRADAAAAAAAGPATPQLSLEDAEIVTALLGIVRWSLDVMAWLVAALFDLRDAVHASAYDATALASLLDAQRQPALHLLLSSATRGMLTALCRRLAHLEHTARKALSLPAAASPALTPALRAAYHALAAQAAAALVPHAAFERFLARVDGYVRDAYAAAGLAGTAPPVLVARNALETKLLLCLPVPALLRPVVERIFTEPEGLSAVLERVVGGLDRLFFMDFAERLGWEEDDERCAGTLGARKRSGKLMDGFFKKRILSCGGGKGVGAGGGGHVQQQQQQQQWKLKRCMRCGLCMEELFISKIINQWLLAQQRKCLCGGSWNLLSPGKTVA